ncbi:hypothetical protein [Lacimicrobium sp. SS2-24]|uniref:hypothetical protein n=1 Tax=Lacimicrobium sp. SS2-24 TaxID=2005569 RepID=UPI000B4B5B95|nr:hypothetical protein [Lacimicrobium sp. SS2-24]
MKISAIILFLLIFTFAKAETNYFEPQGEFAEIDLKKQNEVLKEVLDGDQTTIDLVINQPENYIPPVLYVLSNSLFQKGDKEEGMFWFYAGQLRARSDANKALDKSARQAVSVLNQNFGPLINQYAFKDISVLERVVEKVVLWDSNTERKYDPRWISLHGMDAFSKSTVAFEPKDKWKEINERSRNDYFKSFKDYIEQMQNGS